jgi:hypothetical protein
MRAEIEIRVFDALLRAVGLLLAVTSRFRWRLRAQITRDMLVEVSSDDGVGRRFRLHGRSRRVSVEEVGAEPAEVALRFASSRDGLRALVSRHTVGRIVEGMNYGDTRIDGNPALVLWFHGLTRTVLPIGSTRRPRRTPPIGVREPERTASWAARIVHEPVLHRLDRDWGAAWSARAKLLQIRATDDGRIPPG